MCQTTVFAIQIPNLVAINLPDFFQKKNHLFYSRLQQNLICFLIDKPVEKHTWDSIKIDLRFCSVQSDSFVFVLFLYFHLSQFLCLRICAKKRISSFSHFVTSFIDYHGLFSPAPNLLAKSLNKTSRTNHSVQWSKSRFSQFDSQSVFIKVFPNAIFALLLLFFSWFQFLLRTLINK